MSGLHCGYGHSPSVGAAVTNPKLASHPWLRRSLMVLQLLAHTSRQTTTRQTTPSICHRVYQDYLNSVLARQILKQTRRRSLALIQTTSWPSWQWSWMSAPRPIGRAAPPALTLDSFGLSFLGALSPSSLEASGLDLSMG